MRGQRHPFHDAYPFKGVSTRRDPVNHALSQIRKDARQASVARLEQRLIQQQTIQSIRAVYDEEELDDLMPAIGYRPSMDLGASMTLALATAAGPSISLTTINGDTNEIMRVPDPSPIGNTDSLNSIMWTADKIQMEEGEKLPPIRRPRGLTESLTSEARSHADSIMPEMDALAVALNEWVARLDIHSDSDPQRTSRANTVVTTSVTSSTAAAGEVDFREIFKQAHPSAILQSLDSTQLFKPKCNIDKERAPPEEVLQSLKHNLGLVMPEYERFKAQKNNERQRRVAALTEIHSDFDAARKEADTTWIKDIGSKDLLELIAKSKCSLRNAALEQLGVIEAASVKRDDSIKPMSSPPASVKGEKIRYGAWYKPINQWKPERQHKVSDNDILQNAYIRHVILQRPRNE